MKSIIIFIILILPSSAIAQPNSMAWQQNLNSGNASYNGGAALVSNTDYIFQTGAYFGLTDLDPTISIDTVSGQGIFMTKYKHSGQYIWSKKLINGLGGFIKLDHNNNILIYGIFSGTVDFDPSVVITNNITAVGLNYNYYILKLDSNGNFMWVSTFSGISANGYKNAIAINNANEIIVCGMFNDSLVDFDPGTGTYFLSAPNNIPQGFKLTINANGTFNNVKQLVSSSFIRPDGCVIDPSNNIYITGEFIDSIDLNTTSNNTWLVGAPNFKERFICKYNANDSLIFAKKFGETNLNKSIRQDIYINNYDIYITGNTDTIIDFDPDIGVYWGGDSITQNGYLLKLDSNGIFKWLICPNASSTNASNVFSVLAFDNLNNIHVSGLATSVNALDTLDLDPSAGISEFRYTGQNADFHACYNNSGNLVYLFPIDSVGSTLASSASWDLSDLTILPNNSLVYTGGVFMTTKDIDISSCVYNISTSSSVSMIANYSTCIPSLTELNIIRCDSAYIDGVMYLQDTSFIKKYTNTICCDSNVQYTISIKHLDTSLSVVNNTIMANQANATYQWINCKTQSIIANATNQQYTPLQNGTFAVIINNGLCQDTSACFYFVPTSTLPGVVNPKLQVQFVNEANQLNIRNNDLQSTITIYSIDGKIMYQSKLPKANEKIDMAYMANGIYLVQIGKFISKIVKH